MADNRNLKTGFATHNGARLYYESIGAGPAAVLLHAGLTDMRLWDHSITPLQDAGFTVLRVDLRGFGQSKTEHVPFTHAGDLAAVLDTRDVGEAVLIGSAVGAYAALDFAVEQADRVRALVLHSVMVGGHKADVPEHPHAHLMEQALEAEDYRKAADIAIEMWAVGPGRDRSDLDPDLLEETILVYADLLSKRMNEVFNTDVGIQPNAAERLDALTMPVLTLGGEHDAPLFQAHAAYLHSNVPHAEHSRVEGAGYLLPRERPTTFSALVTGFLRRGPAAVS